MATHTDAYGNVRSWYESPIYSGTTAVQQPNGSYVMIADVIPAHLSSPLANAQECVAPQPATANIVNPLLGYTDVNNQQSVIYSTTTDIFNQNVANPFADNTLCELPAVNPLLGYTDVITQQSVIYPIVSPITTPQETLISDLPAPEETKTNGLDLSNLSSILPIALIGIILLSGSK